MALAAASHQALHARLYLAQSRCLSIAVPLQLCAVFLLPLLQLPILCCDAVKLLLHATSKNISVDYIH